jgi:sec-independent protein translocase protein TatC
MNVWDHLGELRRRLLICVYVLMAGSVAGAFAVNPIIDWLARPVGTLVFLQPTEAFAAQIKIAVGVSFLLGLPVLIYQAWAFVSTGLEDREKRYLLWSVPLSYVFFMGGFAFATFMVFPKAVAFLLTLRSQRLEPMLSVESYLDFFVLLGLAFGFLFQLPLVLHFFAKMGLLRSDFLAQNRRISYLVIFVLATIFNPVPEVFTQLLLACAAITLFELSIFLVRWETRQTTGEARPSGGPQNT